ncbi:MAG: MFS transporter [Chlorobiaceae bacterium]|nr:MFS transporter [Chlorobiaceae bacterium]NTV24798.1 MFS transporter [Chlorobiaceae bacterium]
MNQSLSTVNRPFFHLLSFRILIVLAYQTVAVVAGWHIYELTHDALSLGLVGLAEVIPYFLLALFAGHAIDHYSRKMFGVAASVLLVINALMLAAVSAGVIRGNPVVWIYAAIAVGGVARAFISPTYSAVFAQVLPRHLYAKGSAVGSSVFQLGLVTGPALGGIMVATLGKTTSYGIAAMFCVAAALALFSIRVEKRPPTQSAPLFSSISEGLRFVLGNRIVLGAQMLDMFAVLFGGAVSLLPAFVKDVFHAGPELLGLLRAAPALGGMATGLLLSRYPIRFNNGQWLLGAVAGFGLCIIGFALSGQIWIAALFLLLSGICDGVSVVTRTTIVQLATPDAIRGRVAAINGIFIGSSNELGAFESGLVARLMGLVPSVVFGGVMTLVVVALTGRIAPELRRLDLQQLD